MSKHSIKSMNKKDYSKENNNNMNRVYSICKDNGWSSLKLYKNQSSNNFQMSNSIIKIELHN